MSPLKSVQPLTERRTQPAQVTEQRQSPYLNAREAIAYLRLNSESSLYRLVREHALPTCRRGRLYLFDVREVDAWVRGFSSSLDRARHDRDSAKGARSSGMTLSSKSCGAAR